MASRASANRGLFVACVVIASALGGCRLLTGTGDLVIDEGTSADAAASSGAGGAGGQGNAAVTTGVTTGGGSPSTTATTGTSGAGGGVADCDEYCAALEAQCGGATLQYDTPQNCADYCPYLAAGTDPSADTVACRAKFLPPNAVDCAAAGPGGASQCGDPCQNFCVLALFICPGVYVDLDDCTDFCGTLPDKALTTYAAPADLENTLACRVYYLTREVSAPGVFCASLGQSSNNCM